MDVGISCTTDAQTNLQPGTGELPILSEVTVAEFIKTYEGIPELEFSTCLFCGWKLPSQFVRGLAGIAGTVKAGAGLARVREDIDKDMLWLEFYGQPSITLGCPLATKPSRKVVQ